MLLKASNIVFLNCQRVLKSRLLFCLQTPKPRPSALSRECERQNGPPWFPSHAFLLPHSCRSPCRRINIGERYQAEIPALQDQHKSELEQHRADLVWLPVDDSQLKPSEQQRGQSPSPAPLWCCCCCWLLSLFVRTETGFPVLVSGGADEPGLFQCAQRWRNQPGAGFALFT